MSLCLTLAPLCNPHIRIVRSSLPDASMCGFTGFQLTQLTAPECPANASMNSPELLCHKYTCRFTVRAIKVKCPMSFAKETGSRADFEAVGLRYKSTCSTRDYAILTHTDKQNTNARFYQKPSKIFARVIRESLQYSARKSKYMHTFLTGTRPSHCQEKTPK